MTAKVRYPTGCRVQVGDRLGTVTEVVDAQTRRVEFEDGTTKLVPPYFMREARS